MARKPSVRVTVAQKLEYAKLMVESGYTNKQIEQMSGAGQSAVSRWKAQYLSEISGKTPENKSAITPEQQRIQELEKQLERAQRDNMILKKAAAFFIQENQNYN